MIAADTKRVLRNELEDDLTNARHMAVIVQWIGVARDFHEGVRGSVKSHPEWVDQLKVVGVGTNGPEWGECEGLALRHLHLSLECSVRDIETKIGLNDRGAE